MSNNLFVKHSLLQFRSRSIVAYDEYVSSTGLLAQQYGRSSSLYDQSAKHKANSQLLVQREKYTGKMTAGAKKRLTKAISLLVQSSPKVWVHNPVLDKLVQHHLTFITITLPDVSKSKDASFCHKHILQPVLRILRNRHGMKSYVWKCELQKNGSVHYHLTSDLFIVHTDLKNIVNNITRALGMLDEFKEKYGHDNPNSTDIHAVNNVRDLESYLVKYISKEYQNEVSLKAKIWDCSKNLKQAKYFTTTLTTELHQQILTDIDTGILTPVYADKCVILKSSTTDYYSGYPAKTIDEYHLHLKAIRQWDQTQKQTTGSNTMQSWRELFTTAISGQCGISKSGCANTSQLYLKLSG